MSVFDFTLPSYNDQSVRILNQITGVVDSILPASTAGSSAPTLLTFTDMLKHFNYYLLGFGLIIFAILLFVGTMNTAADGQFLGRNWNSVWTPVRLILGVLFVVPLKSGLCIGQYIFLYVILVGINIATHVWNGVVDDVFQKYNPPAIPSYVDNYAKNALSNQLVLSSVEYIQHQVFNPPKGAPCDLNNSQLALIQRSYGWLGTNFPTPQAAFSLTPNQYPVQYNAFVQATGAVTQADMAVLGRAVLHYSAYLANLYYSNQNQQQPHDLAYYDGCAVASPADEVTIPVTVNTTYTAGTMSQSNFGAILIGKISNYVEQNICENPAMYTDSSIVGSCGWAVHKALDSVDYAAGQYQSGRNGFSGGTYIWFGSKNYDPQQHPVSLNPAQIWPEADGLISVAGTLSYSISGQPSTNATDLNPGLSSSFRNEMNAALQQVIQKNVANVSNPDNNLCENNNSCDLQPLVDKIINNVRQQIEDQTAAQLYTQNADGSTTVAGTYSQSNCKDRSVGAYCLPGNDGKYIAEGQYYKVEGMPFYDAEGNLQQGAAMLVPLKGSWWNAGESYLILDDQFAKNLKVLTDLIQSNTIDFLNGGNSTVSGSLQVSTKLGVAEAGKYYVNAFNNGSDSLKQGSECNILSDGINSCYLDQMRFYAPQPLVMNLSPDKATFASLGGLDNWNNLIQVYNPDAGSDIPLRANVPQSFYDQLQAVPYDYQMPLAVLLISAKMASDKKEAGCNGNCYIVLYPYLQNLLNILSVNGLLETSKEELPLNQAMNSMFDQLLGTPKGIDFNNATGGSRARSISSVMQEVYNLGIATDGDIVSQQFSLIQQARDAGVGMIVACMGAMQDVYGNYKGIMNALVDKVNSQAQQSLDGAKEAIDLSYVPFVGQIGEAMVKNYQSQAEIAIMTTTVTTLSNVGIQLMWLPLFLFVMTSLFVAGVQFALLVPFMPYIMFWAGQMAWVIGVIEALVAAPLVMLAFAHPGGNDYMGHAAPAMRFLIGIIFRPVLMVIGLVTGILLTYILINYSAQGFHVIAAGIFNSLPGNNQMLMGVMSCLLLFTYGSFLVMAFTKCFSPIYVIPEKVVQWINGHADRAGEQESQQFSSGVQQSAQQGAQAGGQALQSGIQAQQQRGQQMSDLSSKSMSAQYTQTLNTASADRKMEEDSTTFAVQAGKMAL